MHNQIDHILTNKRQYSSIVDVRYSTGADFDADHYHYHVLVNVKETDYQYTNEQREFWYGEI